MDVIYAQKLWKGQGWCSRLLMGMPTDQPWAASREGLKRYLSDLTSLGHAAAQLENLTQWPDESLHIHIDWYSKIYYAATNKTVHKNTDSP